MCLRPCSSPSLPVSGMARNHETEADLSGQGLQPADAILIASDLKFMAVLTELGLGYNKIGDEGAKAFAAKPSPRTSEVGHGGPDQVLPLGQ